MKHKIDQTFEELCQHLEEHVQFLLMSSDAFDKGFEGEIPELKINCNCRKPKPGMILDAEKNYNIDLSASYMIGDSDIDVELGHNARLKGSYKIQTNNPDQMNKIVDSIFESIK